MSLFEPGSAHYCIRYSLALVLFSIGTRILAAELPRLQPNIVDFDDIARQHYGRKQYSVLTDTVRTSAFPFKKWVVRKEAVIPVGTKLTVPSDAEVYFEPGASLTVNGTFEAIGSEYSPIVFSCIDPSDIAKRPRDGNFHWKGIAVGNVGKLVLKNVRISDAEGGIVSNGRCDSLVIESLRVGNTHPFTLKAIDISTSVDADEVFNLQCPAPKTKGRSGTPRLVYWMYGCAAASAIASGAFNVAAHLNDQDAAEATDHFTAQPLADKATRQYRVSLGTGIAAACLAVPAVVVHIYSRIRKDLQ